MKSWRQCPRLYPWANSSLPACWYWSCSSSMMNKCPPLSKLTSRSSCEIPECNNTNKKTNNCSASKLQTIQSWPSVHCFPTILKDLLKIQVNGRRRRRCVHSTLPRRKNIQRNMHSWMLIILNYFLCHVLLSKYHFKLHVQIVWSKTCEGIASLQCTKKIHGIHVGKKHVSTIHAKKNTCSIHAMRSIQEMYLPKKKVSTMEINILSNLR